MRLTLSQVYSYENKYNPIGAKASSDLKNNNLTTFCELFVYSNKNNIKTF